MAMIDENGKLIDQNGNVIPDSVVPNPEQKPEEKPKGESQEKPDENPRENPDPDENPRENPDPDEKPKENPDPDEKPKENPDPDENPRENPDPDDKPKENPDPDEKPKDDPENTPGTIIPDIPPAKGEEKIDFRPVPNDPVLGSDSSKGGKINVPEAVRKIPVGVTDELSSVRIMWVEYILTEDELAQFNKLSLDQQMLVTLDTLIDYEGMDSSLQAEMTEDARKLSINTLNRILGMQLDEMVGSPLHAQYFDRTTIICDQFTWLYP